MSSRAIPKLRSRLLRWYDANRRDIPWRAAPGTTPDPYHVWLSEIMCQQTTVAAVIPYYRKFLKAWPDVHALANAETDEIMNAWAGLGYYARARNLHACAKIVSGDMKGIFPDEPDALRKLPGIGEYTAAAIAAIAFNKPAVVVDGNVERVLARLFALRKPLAEMKMELRKRAAPFFQNRAGRPGDLAQAFMDLGATVCIPGAPRCPLCPLKSACAAYAQGIAQEIPVRKKPARVQKFGHVYWIAKGDKILLHRRASKGLLGGMIGLPTSTWEQDPGKIAAPAFLRRRIISDRGGSVDHVFSHFALRLDLKEARIDAAPAGHFWASPREAEDAGLPSLFRKALKAGLIVSKPGKA